MEQEQIRRALRELEAARSRVERDAKSVEDDTRRRLVAQLLPVLDNLDRTIDASGERGEAPALLEGARLVREQLETVLRGYGVERVDAVDQPFDPAVHDAVALREVPSRDRHDLVIDQLQPSYRYGDKLLRPAKVVVGRHSSRG